MNEIGDGSKRENGPITSTRNFRSYGMAFNLKVENVESDEILGFAGAKHPDEQDATPSGRPGRSPPF
jgi:hypothetical protein